MSNFFRIVYQKWLKLVHFWFKCWLVGWLGD